MTRQTSRCVGRDHRERASPPATWVPELVQGLVAEAYVRFKSNTEGELYCLPGVFPGGSGSGGLDTLDTIDFTIGASHVNDGS